MTDTKPREFWIHEDTHTYDVFKREIDFAEYSARVLAFTDGRYKPIKLHVIETTAVESRDAIIKELIRELEKNKDNFEWVYSANLGREADILARDSSANITQALNSPLLKAWRGE